MQVNYKNQILSSVPWISISSFIFFTLLFLIYPTIDISFSSLFFYNKTFPLQMDNNIFIAIIDRLIQFGGMALWIIFVGYFGIKELKTNGFKNLFGFGMKRKLIYISSVGLIGSVSIVRIIKWHMMRCRPSYIDVFGGPAAFTKVWTRNVSFYHEDCVSFVSGHSATGFLLFSLAFLYPKSDSRRKKYILLSIFVGSIFGFVRIIQGQHFISDVIFSGYIVYFSALILSYFLKPDRN